MPDLVMPRLSDSMVEATIVEWLKEVGDMIAPGEEVAVVETDKASVPLEATDGGLLNEIVVAAGETAPLGAVLARVGDSDQEPTPSVAQEAQPTAQTAPVAADAPSLAPVAAASSAPPPPAKAGRAKATPVARRIARARGIDLMTVAGTGPNGRIVKADLENLSDLTSVAGSLAVAENGRSAQVAVVPARDGVSTKGERVEQGLTRLQEVIARRMAESKATVPDFVLQAEVDMEACVALRAQLKELDPDATPSFNDMVVKACALALRRFPVANGSFEDGRFVLHSRVNVGVAVATDSALIVPTVVDADLRSLGDIARVTRALAAKARDGSITPSELSGGTFTVSNLGMFGITRFSAIVNPPQAAILAVGAIREVPAIVDGAVAARRRMDISLTCDHRILYGAEAAAFLAGIRELLEQPLRLAL